MPTPATRTLAPVQTRRTNFRLRRLIDDMQGQIQNRRDLGVQFQRIAALQADVDRLIAQQERRRA